MTTDLIIPAYKPDKTFLEAVDAMASQTVSFGKIIVINTEQKYFDRLVYSAKFLDEHKSLDVRHISKREFDCGKTCNFGAKISQADSFIIMSQNVVPDSPEVVAKLISALESDPKIAVAYARQAVCNDYPEMDKYVKRYFFPEDSTVFSAKDLDSIRNGSIRGLNGCAAYRREVFDELGGFVNHIICDEDVVYAHKVLEAGYKIAYVSDAVVVDHTRLAAKEHMKVAFDFGVCVLKNPEVFDYAAVKDNSRKVEKLLLSHLKRKSFSGEAFELRHICRAEKAGYKKALKYSKMSSNDLHKYTANPEYWRMDEILRDRKSVDGHSGYGRSDAEIKMLSQPPVRAFKREDEE
ncbi:MAG: glycosyltransferase family 2 protein [Lachnospiraceae bacterium]|nr:glycosyltransferase family 2 protein [Lachnospiraceae bacterium]